MLRYVGYGWRDWRTGPMPTHRRVNWEFQAILKGRARPTLDNGQAPAGNGPTLWVFPPETSHGWISDDPAGVEIASIHFSSIDPFIEKIIRRQGWLSVGLRPADVTVIDDTARELWSHYWKPTVVGDLHATRAMATLCLIAVREHTDCQQPVAPKAAVATVEAAERWILAHIGDDKAISDAAQAAGVSRPQLYRLIHQLRGCSPRSLLLRLRFEAAKRIMADSSLKLDAVAAECGFSNASAFCRAFRAAHGCTPTKWRSEYHILHRRPEPGKSGDVEAHHHSLDEMRAMGPIETLVASTSLYAARGVARGSSKHHAA